MLSGYSETLDPPASVPGLQAHITMPGSLTHEEKMTKGWQPLLRLGLVLECLWWSSIRQLCRGLLGIH